MGAAIGAGPDELPPFEGRRAFPVRDRGELLGALTVSMPAAEPLSKDGEQLVIDLASQAGLVLRNVRLIEELQESRRRIVTAQDERARKLERDIHDGAQQQLVALSVKLGLAEHARAARRGQDHRAAGRAQVRRLRRPGERPRPRARHLPARARRSRPARGARGAGRKAPIPCAWTPTARALPLRDRGGRLLLLPRGAAEHRQVRGRPRRDDPAGTFERRPDVRGRGRRSRVRPRGGQRFGPDEHARSRRGGGRDVRRELVPGSGTTVGGRIPVSPGEGTTVTGSVPTRGTAS